MIEKYILKFAYFLERSDRYYNVKHFVYQFLEDPHSKKKKYFDFFMIFLVLSTIGILIYEVNHPPLPALNDYEIIAVGVFILEWLGRFWVISHSHKQIIKDYEKSQLINQPFELKKSIKKIIKIKLNFIFSPMSIIDLMAILPSYRPLRILRILMLFRIFKLLRYANSIKQFSDVFIEKKFEFFTLSIMFMMAIAFGSTIIFLYEGSGVNDHIHSFFDAVYWAVITISTVGFGDISPVTIQGRIATIFLVIGGLSVIAFFTSIVTTALGEKIIALKEEKIIGEANSLKNFIIICGYGQMGKALAKEFLSIKQAFIVIDYNNDMLVHATEQQILSIKGDATDPDFLSNVGINKGASSIIALTNDDAVNLSIVLTARALNQNINIIARANDTNIEDKLSLAGANHVIAANDIASLIATEYIGQPIAFNAIDDILLDNEGAVMTEVDIVENSPYIGKKLDIIDFENYNFTLIGIIQSTKNNSFKFNPHKDQYIIQPKDIFIVIGYEEVIAKFKVDLLTKHASKKDFITKEPDNEK
jgi:voltage-gated potassium channel